MLKFIDKAKQGLYIGVFKGAELPFFVFMPIFYCVMA